MIFKDLSTISQDTTDGSLSGTKVRLRSGAGRSLADEGHVTPKGLEILLWKDTHPGIVNCDVRAKNGSLLVHTKQIQYLPAFLRFHEWRAFWSFVGPLTKTLSDKII